MYPDMQSYCTSFDRFSKISFYGMKQPLSDLLDDGLVRNGIIVSNHYQPGYYVDPENPDNIDLVKGVIRRQASEQGLTEFAVKTVDAGTFRKGASPLKTGDRYYDTTGIVYYRDLFDRTEPRATRLREEAKAEAEKQERMEKAQTEHSKDLESAKQEISAYCIKLGGPDAWCTAQADRLIEFFKSLRLVETIVDGHRCAFEIELLED